MATTTVCGYIHVRLAGMTQCKRGHEHQIMPNGRKRCMVCQNERRYQRRNRRVVRTLEERLWAMVDVGGPDECWLWTGSVHSHPIQGGYGQIREGGTGSRTLRAHRVAYEIAVGPIPEGLVLDHTCHDGVTCRGLGAACPHRRCCNPAHLKPVTHAENVSRTVPLAALHG